jgi:hypothetical protein
MTVVESDECPTRSSPRGRFPDRDAHQPAPQGAIAPERGEPPVGDEEGVLRRVLGVDGIAEDPPADGEDGRRLALDELAERIAIAGQDGIDQGAIGDASLVVRGPILPPGRCIWSADIPSAPLSINRVGRLRQQPDSA